MVEIVLAQTREADIGRKLLPCSIMSKLQNQQSGSCGTSHEINSITMLKSEH